MTIAEKNKQTKKPLKNTYKMIRESKQYKTTEKMIKEKRRYQCEEVRNRKAIRHTENKYQNGRRKLFPIN